MSNEAVQSRGRGPGIHTSRSGGFFSGHIFFKVPFSFYCNLCLLGFSILPLSGGNQTYKRGLSLFFFFLVYPWFEQLVRGVVFWFGLQ